jgi:parallel beta helix pectate lyase-like protein
VTDAELRDLAVAALKATTVSYPTWKKKVDQGAYPDVTKTKWWQAFSYLEQIGGVTPPPPSGLGSSLPARLPQSTGPVVNVGTVAELNAALSAVAAGTTIKCAARDYVGLRITRVATATAPITVDLTGSRLVAGGGEQYPLRLSGRYIRVRGAEITSPAGTSSANVYFLGSDCELDRCDIHGNGTATQTSGIFSDSGSARLQVWYSRIHDVGVQANNDHGVYIEGTGHALIGCLFHGCNKGYGLQIYPVASNILVAGCTVARNPYKSGFVVGGSSVSGVLIVNCIVAHHVEEAIRTYQNGSGMVRDSCLWDPSDVGHDWVMQEQRIHRVDPQLSPAYRAAAQLPLGDPAYCPPLYRDGTPRMQATLGSELPA